MPVTVEELRIEYASRVAAQAKADETALLNMAKAMGEVGAKTQATDEVLKRASQTHARVVNQIDGVAAATKRLEAAEVSHASKVAAVMDAYRRGEIPLQKAQQDIARLNTLFDQSSQKAIEAGRAIEARFVPAGAAITKSTGEATQAVRQLGIQSIDVFQQMASGAPVMTTFIQQGGQMAQIMAVTGTSVGSLARAVGGLVLAFAPLIAATAGVAALGFAIGSVASRSMELEAQQRALGVAIAGVGRSAELSTDQMQGYVTALKQQGVAATEAQAAITALARNPSLSGSAIGRIVGLAPDAAAASGRSIQETFTLLSEGAKGSLDGILKLDEAFNLLTASQVSNIRTMVEHGDKTKAVETAFDALSNRVSGLNRDALSPMQQAFRDLSNGWSEFINRIASSEPVLALMQRAADVLRNTTVADVNSRITDQMMMINRLNSGGVPAQPGQLERAQRMLDELFKQRDSLLAKQTPPVTVSGSMAPPIDAASKETERLAVSRAEGTDAGRLAKLNSEIEKFRAQQKALGPVTEENKNLFDTYTKAIAANEKAIEDLTKKNETHRTGLEKTTDKYDAQIDAAKRLNAAYGVSRAEVARITAVREAEEKAISGGLTKGTERYTAAVERNTAKILELRRLEGEFKISEQIRDLDEQAEAQSRIAAAYDGTAESIIRATNEEKAFSAVRDKFPEWTAEAASAQTRYADALNRSSDASRSLDQAQRSVAAIMDTLSNAADRVGQGIIDAMLSGAGAAVNLGNVLRSVVASALTDFAKLALINPLKNSLLGGTSATLSSGLGILAGGRAGNGWSGEFGGATGIYDAVSNVSTFGGISDALGLTDFAGKLSGIGDYLGMTGSNGLFGGVGNAITGFLNTQIGFGTLGVQQATNLALAQMGGQFGPAPLAAVQSAQAGGATIGGLLSGVGLGYGAGSLAGGFLQSSLGKVGPGPQIGAGGGAIAGAAIGSIIPGIGTVIGGLLGGLLGGGGGGLIGPKAATPFSATGLNNNDGLLAVGQTFSQIVDVSGEVTALQEQAARINQVLAETNLRIANGFSNDQFGQNRIIGGNSGQWLNFGQGDGRPRTLVDAFSELRFGVQGGAAISDTGTGGLNILDGADQSVIRDRLITRNISNRGFDSLEQLQEQVTRILDFVNSTAPALVQLGQTDQTFGIGSYATTINELNRRFDDAIATARELGLEETQLTNARAKALAVAQHAPSELYKDVISGLNVRYLQAQAINDNNPALSQQATLIAFDTRAMQERKAFEDQLLGILGDAGRTSQFYLDRMAELERTTAAERLAILTQFNQSAVQSDLSAQEARSRGEQSALSAITNIADFSRSLSFSDQSPLNARSQYSLALGNFRDIAAGVGNGDFNSLSKLPEAASQLLSSSRGLFGSGTQYATDFASVQAVLRGSASQSPEAIIAQAIEANTTQQTAVLASILEQVRDGIESILAETRLQGMRQAA